MYKHFLLSCAGMVLLLVSCSKKYNPSNTPFAIYHPIAEENVRKLEKAVTTPPDVVKFFGEPAKNSISEKGERYVYGYLGDTLTVNFDSSQTVSNFLYRPAIFSPVAGNTDNMTKHISESKVRRIEIYNTTRQKLEEWFRKANKKETGLNRNRYTFERSNGTLVAYVLANYEERVLSYTFTPR